MRKPDFFNRHGLDKRLAVHQLPLEQLHALGLKFNLVAANLPYIPEACRSERQEELTLEQSDIHEVLPVS